MCELCNGTHVILQLENWFAEYHTCPNCGPKSQEAINQDLDKLQMRLEEFERSLNQKSA